MEHPFLPESYGLLAFVAVLVTGVVLVCLGVPVADAGTITASLIIAHAAWQGHRRAGAGGGG
ncbi:hypothetical protein [Streptomyces cupreus]|uniref:Uncharacterized protein n=1 Tax=Streptomyces cupreus TaxID=2759956 RepID=A0A7X1JDE7_9ACTN|nr:hypothetical protein [Streptomyces cupreus]MBC2908254.1 hypothetical protein [Streptomyces cupreus]